VLPNGLGVRLRLRDVPVLPVFRWLAAVGGITEPEMLRTFNCGIGMIVVATPDEAEALMARFGQAGETAVLLGEVIPAEGARVTYDGHLDLAW